MWIWKTKQMNSIDGARTRPTLYSRALDGDSVYQIKISTWKINLFWFCVKFSTILIFSFQIVYKTKYCLDWNSGKITMVKNLTRTKKIIKIFSISLFDHTHHAWLNSYQSKKIIIVENLTCTQKIFPFNFTSKNTLSSSQKTYFFSLIWN